MKVVIVNCNDPYENRVELLYEYFTTRNHNVSVIASDFRHFHKVRRTDKKKDYIFIKSKPYYKNISVARLSSHYLFARNAFKLLETMEVDLIYVLLPPNSLAVFASKYKLSHPKVKLCFDIIDLWPEAMVAGKVKSLFPFKIWKNMRNKNLGVADYVITECDLFHKVLGDILQGVQTSTIHMARKDEGIKINPQINLDEIHLCYLGSINHIIDILTINKLIKGLSNKKPVVLHIIGDGENRDSFIESAKESGARVEYCGKIYEPDEKQSIFDKCHFGLNMMRKTVCVGLTMKSIDYFQAGLPILNNIQGDTTQLVEDYRIGLNVTEENIEAIVDIVINSKIDELLKMRFDTRKVFETMLTDEVFYEKMEEVMARI